MRSKPWFHLFPIVPLLVRQCCTVCYALNCLWLDSNYAKLGDSCEWCHRQNKEHHKRSGHISLSMQLIQKKNLGNLYLISNKEEYRAMAPHLWQECWWGELMLAGWEHQPTDPEDPWWNDFSDFRGRKEPSLARMRRIRCECRQQLEETWAAIWAGSTLIVQGWISR